MGSIYPWGFWFGTMTKFFQEQDGINIWNAHPINALDVDFIGLEPSLLFRSCQDVDL